MIELVGKYTTAKIFAETIEEGVYQQVYDIINCKENNLEGKCILIAEGNSYNELSTMLQTIKISDYV